MTDPRPPEGVSDALTLIQRAIDLQREALARTEAATRAAVDMLAHLTTPPETPLEGPVKRQRGCGPRPLTTPGDHRAAHRPGRPSRLDTDAELRAFVLARLGHATFDQVAAEVARTFPPDRRIRRSALHRWWTLRGRALLRAHATASHPE